MKQAGQELNSSKILRAIWLLLQIGGPLKGIVRGAYFRRLFLRPFFLGRPLVLAQERKKRHLRGESGLQRAGKKDRKQEALSTWRKQDPKP